MGKALTRPPMDKNKYWCSRHQVFHRTKNKWPSCRMKNPPTRLKPCPFCGYIEKTHYGQILIGGGTIHAVCGRCGAFGPAARKVSDIENLWNRRERERK